MIVKPLTFLSAMMFALSGAYLFVVKHQSQVLEDQIEAQAEASRHDQASIRVLQAQWALEADPSRIASLAAQFTGLQPMKPGQLMTLADLASQLPPANSPVPFSNPENVVPAMPTGTPAPLPSGPAIQVQAHVAANDVAAPPATKPAAAPANRQLAETAAIRQQGETAAIRPMAPVLQAAAHAGPRVQDGGSMLAQDSVPAPRRAPHLRHPEALASVEATLHRLQGPHPHHQENGGSALYAENEPAPVRPAASLPMGAQVMSVRAVAAPVAAPVAPVENGGSMLGMAQSGSGN